MRTFVPINKIQRLISMKKIVLTLSITLLAFSFLLSQVVNDECDTAISVLANGCSEVGEYTVVDATPSGFGAAPCMTNVSHDVWFSFVAVAPDATITVIGNSGAGGGGTLSAPEIALYSGNCGGTINQEQCETNTANNGILELYKGGLTVGQTYYIRVDGRNNVTGTFELCVANYNPPVNPGSDCDGAQEGAFLCDKSSFVVPSISGAGNDADEISDSCLGGFGGNSESNSTWFKWTCDVTGPLTFTLAPTNLADDLDFVVYELPNGVDNCGGKIVRKCMAAGDSTFPSPCMGPTGLRTSANGDTEEPGCGGGNDSWLSPLNMQAGVSYALAINNFTSTGNGFSIEFGGDGTFQGPEADFTINDADNVVCMGADITVTDASFANNGNNIIGYSWNFGVDAVPATAGGIGSHDVVYNSVGTKSIVLTVENNLGCIITKIKQIVIDPCCETDNAMDINGIANELECFDDPNGAIDLTVVSPFPISSYEWNTGANTEDVNGLTGGDYTVTITNQFCEEEASFNVFSPPAFEFDTIMTLATCNGGSDGTLTLNVTGATPPFEFNWNGGGFVLNDNFRGGLIIGLYNVTVRDANNCEKGLTLEVEELVLELDPDVSAVFPPSCFGFSDGRIELIIDNGLAPFQFDWNDGNGYVSDNSIENIAEGNYLIDVLDANGCEGQFNFFVDDPDLLEVDLDSTDVSCFGLSDGIITPTTTGGTYPYSYLWSDNQTDSVAIDLVAGIYTVTITDANGCIVQDEIEVVEPPELFIDSTTVVDVLCYGDSTGQITVYASGGNPPYFYSYDGLNFQDDSVLVNVPAGVHPVTVLDGMECTTILDVSINQPLELIAMAGEDLTVSLGYSIEIEGAHSPPFRYVDTEWTPDYNLNCNDCFQPTATPYETTTYYMNITDEDGCMDTDTMTIFVNKERPIFIPNAFTPNDDGINDIFTAYGGPALLQIDELQIFDRWGGLVYRGNNLPGGNDANLSGWDGTWNGKDMNLGVYVYLMRIRFVDGFLGLYKGDVTLLQE
jgi:gliding motility-associated-like protein